MGHTGGEVLRFLHHCTFFLFLPSLHFRINERHVHSRPFPFLSPLEFSILENALQKIVLLAIRLSPYSSFTPYTADPEILS